MADHRLNIEERNTSAKGRGQMQPGVNHAGKSPSAVHSSEEMRSRGRRNDRTRRGKKGGTGKKATH